jgi:perosamine synthetase
MVPLVRPDLGDAEVDATARVIRSGWITQGPEVAAFEKELAAYLGAPHACAVANCTVALELALRVVGVGVGDEVIVVSHSFVATANAIVSVGAVPVFVDVVKETWGMDPASMARAITKKTKAILCVHQVGLPCDIRAIVKIADAHGIPVVEDAACAIGSDIDGDAGPERIGRPHGTIACFSFHPRKVLTTGDGGLITTRDAALDARCRLLRQHAMSISDVKRHSADSIVFEDYVEPAFNYRMTDLQAAVGRPQLARMNTIIAERRRLAAVYADALRDSRVFVAPRDPPGARSNWQSYPTTLRSGLKLSQRAVMETFLRAGIATKRGVSNAHQEPAYAGTTRARIVEGGLPVSEFLRDNVVLLPLFHGMRADEQARVLAVCHELDTIC